MKRALALILCVAAGVAACRGTEQKAAAPAPAAEPAFNLAIQPIGPPAQGTSSQPQLTASDRGIVLSWLEQKDDLATLKFSDLTSDAAEEEVEEQAKHADAALQVFRKSVRKGTDRKSVV